MVLVSSVMVLISPFDVSVAVLSPRGCLGRIDSIYISLLTSLFRNFLSSPEDHFLVSFDLVLSVVFSLHLSTNPLVFYHQEATQGGLIPFIDFIVPKFPIRSEEPFSGVLRSGVVG